MGVALVSIDRTFIIVLSMFFIVLCHVLIARETVFSSEEYGGEYKTCGRCNYIATVP